MNAVRSMADPHGQAVLTPAEMAQADRLAIGRGPFTGHALMRRAGAAVAREALARFPGASAFLVLCGPGNNGGDGYVAARLLAESGAPVRIFAAGAPAAGSDAATAAADCPLGTQPLSAFAAELGAVVIDALFGAGLSRGLDEDCAQAAAACAGMPVIAVDLPSGVPGETGRPPGACFRAAVTVTFFRLKPGHLLEPGRGLCGEIVVADIGIPGSVLDDIAPALHANGPVLWRAAMPAGRRDQHKYSRGHVAVFSGGPTATGAARLAAMAAARAGAGAVTVLSPPRALAVNAAHLTSIMLHRITGAQDAAAFARDRKARALVFGPGLDAGAATRQMLFDLLGLLDGGTALVLDASGITAAAAGPERLFALLAGEGAPPTVLTPHEGEFARLFPDIAGDAALSKVERARAAARRSRAVVVLKGPDTVVARLDGRAVINANGVPWLATAGSGDVLAGVIAALCAQGMAAFEAACAAVWLHGEAGAMLGRGLIAEDLPRAVARSIGRLLDPPEGRDPV